MIQGDTLILDQKDQLNILKIISPAADPAGCFIAFFNQYLKRNCP